MHASGTGSTFTRSASPLTFSRSLSPERTDGSVRR
uniref:Uncharacterized protein n=1 Tax=Parascaris equorum TaxID=6256 RepID=A0A914S687_PAREQ